MLTELKETGKLSETVVRTSRRADALDALRGAAILLMILSGSIPFSGTGQLPGWMYHGQLPPPDHIFNPNHPGITWVDLVFPFFLFAMGTAFPFALNSRLKKGIPEYKISLQIIGRGLLLAAFAIYIQHIKPYALSPSPGIGEWILALLGFILLFPVLLRLPEQTGKLWAVAVKAAGVICAVILIYLIDHPDGFSLNRSDIIILVLANVAVFGSLIWLITRNNILLRLGFLGMLLALRLTQNIEGSWNVWLWNFSPFPWLYKMYYLQYLFIVIPGTIAGDLIYEWMNTADKEKKDEKSFLYVKYLLVLMFSFIVLNLAGLYSRFLVTNLLLNSILIVYGFVLFKHLNDGTGLLYKKLFGWGAYWLALGLFFEAFEGGIKKDRSTLSYYFVTTGLALFCYIAFSIITDYLSKRNAFRLLIENGQNPMIAYIAGSNFILPLLALTSLNTLLGYLVFNPWLGLLKGLIFTSLVALVTAFFTRRKLFWRT